MRLRDGTEVADPRLGRIPSFDERSRAFPARTALPAQYERTRLWYLPSSAPVLNQQRGYCVGCGVTNDLRYTPVPILGLDETFAEQRIYWEAQRIDEWEGGSYPSAAPTYEGTSVLAGVKAATAQGYYVGYRWCFSEPELALAVGWLGPVLIGVTWTYGMLETDSRGYISPAGDALGGHCVLVVGVSVKRGAYTIQNSWSAGWGVRGGKALVTRADMRALLADNGEACVPVGRTRPKAST